MRGQVLAYPRRVVVCRLTTIRCKSLINRYFPEANARSYNL